MGFELIRFYLQLLLPQWMQNREPDKRHFHRRRLTPVYRRKRRKVAALWTAAGLLMLLIQAPSFIISASLLTTFISFSLLDETEG
ncbi:MAG: hypothetical protein OIF55_04870 [Amphritea sp.]|nr:hypothetical protein [Amphritea sp.]